MRLAHQWQWRGDRLVIFSDASFNLRRFELNLLGGFVWELSGGTLSGAEIVTEIGQIYPDVPMGQLGDLVGAFLCDLEAEWLLTSKEALAEYE